MKKGGDTGCSMQSGASGTVINNPPRLVTLSAKDVQAADRRDFIVFFVGLYFVAVEYLGPLVGRNDVLISSVIPNRALGLVNIDLNLALRGAQRSRNSLLHAFLLGHEFGIAAEQNISAAAGHVGGNGHHALASRLGHELSLALVILG